MMANEEPNAIASIDEHEQLYDVFLSFRGSDTRLSFTGNLFNALCNKRFKTFMDNDGLKSGNQILPSIFKALERSRVAIVVLSKNYAASTYCLDELVNILECKKTKKQLVFPIFYDVHPFEVRYQTGSYDVVSHEYRFGKDQKLQNWKAALSEVSTISGLHFENSYHSQVLALSISWKEDLGVSLERPWIHHRSTLYSSYKNHASSFVNLPLNDNNYSIWSCVNNLKEEYLVLLAETIPFLGELLEDVELSVKSLAQEILREMESMSGESLQQYL
ncbi:hypothetical protein TSUD_258570 [Trifolium subterraneum]|uniref:TIR domain-containing protein n=1 Tax=Trifolium subterraneum TaxID=3900 RepID=A0A2Z6N581_TRISU|nr:hypothetical protein TSUD_258570 [Trifolium subterraneum]